MPKLQSHQQSGKTDSGKSAGGAQNEDSESRKYMRKLLLTCGGSHLFTARRACGECAKHISEKSKKRGKDGARKSFEGSNMG